jgi:putative ABC transport system substrate-binding protein
MKRRITGFILGTMLLALSVPAQAQQAKKTPRIGFLMPGSRSTYSMRIEAFRNGLRELGYTEGQNIAIEWRFVEGKSDRLAGFAPTWSAQRWTSS